MNASDDPGTRGELGPDQQLEVAGRSVVVLSRASTARSR